MGRKKKHYLKENKYFTLVDEFKVGDTKVEAYLDDYGQCYHVAWLNKDGEVHEESCGTYNEDYKGAAEFSLNGGWAKFMAKLGITLEDSEDGK